MRKVFSLLMIFVLTFALTGCGDDKKPEQPAPEVKKVEQPAPEEKKVEQPSPEVKKVETNNKSSAVESETTKVTNKVNEYVKQHYSNTTVDSITVNPNLGTEKDGDYIALVRLTWKVNNGGETSKKMLDMYSSDMAARMYKDLPEIQELAVFWTVPYLNNGKAKISFERVSNGMRYTDKVFDNNFNKK